jgi:murein DD-endopeptidase MepM/ murein hydrolase activator NlpD
MKNNKFKQYLEKKGFYIVFLIGIFTVIGTTTFVTHNNLNKIKKSNEQQNLVDLDEEFGDYDLQDVDTINAYQNDLEVSEEQAQQAGAATSQNSDVATKPIEKTIVKNPNTKQSKPVALAKPKAQSISKTMTFTEKDKMDWPICGKIVMDYSADKLIYDPTLEQYKVHPAICIAAENEGDVKAAAKGKVEVIQKDPETGVTVVLDHGNGWKSVYGQLQKNIRVQQNQTVEKGEVIGAVGKPTIYSSSLGNHIYFQVTKDQKPMDPKKLLNKQQ